MNSNVSLFTLAIFAVTLSSSSLFSCDEQASKVLAEPLPKDVPGTFAINFKNMTKTFPDDKIFLQFFGLNGPALPNKKLSAVTVKITGNSDEGSLGHQVRATSNAVLPAIKLSDLKNKTLYLPQKASGDYPEDGKFYGSRIYISLGAPLASLKVNADGSGTAQPTFADNDMSVNTVFDWIEFTYDPENSAGGPQHVTFGGNPTGVDQFAIPLWMKIYGDKNSEDGPVGIFLRETKFSPSCIASREDIVKGFLSSVSAPFKNLVQGNANGQAARILSPVKSAKFLAGSKNYFDQYIDEVWATYRKQELKFCDVYDPKSNEAPKGSCFIGNVVGDELTFYRTSGRAAGAQEDCTKEKPCKMKKPSSLEIFENGGVFALPADQKLYPNGVVDYNLFGSQLVAAMARHAATNIFTSGALAGYVDFHGKSLPLYEKTPNHEYAKYFHSLGIHHRFYGMGYDDVGAPPKHDEAKDLRYVGGPLVFMNQPGERVKAIVVGIQW